MAKHASRRDFLRIGVMGAAGAVVPLRQGTAAPKSLTMLHETSFIPAYDAYFKTVLGPAYEKASGVKVNYELVTVGSLQAEVTSAADAGSGPDLTLNFFSWPFLYGDKYVDVSDIAEEVGNQSGGWYEPAKEAVVVNGKWKAILFGNVGQLMNWRTDWFKEVGYSTFPDTWEELLEAGTKLKRAGHPFGFGLGHGFGDNHGWLYPLLWSYGAREVEPDGKTIVLDSDETARAVDFCRNFYQDTMMEEVITWTDTSNNKAFLTEQISCTNNAASILYVAKKEFPAIGRVTEQSLNPQGPKGRFHILAPWSHSIFTRTEDQKVAKDFLRWLMQPDQVGPWYASAASYYAPFLKKYDDAPLWHVEPRNLPYRDSLATSHLPGWPAPPSRPQAESVAKYVIVDMFAKACTGGSTRDVIAEAVAQLRQIYRSAA
jgi:multiple sugar transport system substrate-binding protein